MGRIVINQTENKQTVILNDSPEGVEGGYFDADMIWHDLGGADLSPVIPDGIVIPFHGTNINQKAAFVSTECEIFYANNIPSTGTEYGVRLLLPPAVTPVNGTGTVSGLTTLFEVTAGDIVSVIIEDFTLDSPGADSYVSLVLRNDTTSSSELKLSPLDGEGEYDITATEAFTCNNVMVYFAKAVPSAHMRIKFLLNGERVL